MRDIKFRAWDSRNKKWLDCTSSQLPRYLRGYLSPVEEHVGEQSVVIQQFTNIFYENWTEMYEGDIVEYYAKNVKRIGTVEYSDYYNGWCIRDTKCYPMSEFGCFSLASPYMAFNSVELLGNIFDNPDLVK